MLSPKHQVFVDEYLICWNSSEAARRAGYNGKSNVIGPRLLANVSIKEEITRRLKEKHLTADMVLARLSDMATSNLADFASIKTSEDLAANRDIAYLAKKFKRKITRYDNDPNKEYEEIEIELYDAQSALEKIGRHLVLFTDKFEHGSDPDKPVIVKNLKGVSTDALK